MALTKTLQFGSTSNQRPYGVLTVTETATSAASNTSTLSIKLALKRPSSISSSATKTASCTINGVKYSWSGSIGGSGDKTLITKTQTVTHNADGTKTINLAAEIALNITWGGTSLGTISGSGTMALTKIPRYATIAQSLSSREETAVVMAWTSDSIIDYLWYSTNNGASWTGINIADGKSGTYTITGLSPNTKYNIKTRVRRKDTQQTTDSTALAVTTYSYPYCNSTPDFTIGDKLTLGFYNPLKRSITVNIIGADDSQISNDTTTGTSISGYNGATVVSRLLNSIPNAKSGAYKVKVTYGNSVITSNGGTYTVGSNVKPSIGALSYQDTNAATVAITGNNQQIIRNKSTVQFTAQGLTGSNSATVAACSVNVNGNIYNLTVDGSTATGGNVTIDSATDLNVIFTVTDSRGLTATKQLTVNMLDWVLPTAIIECQRQNNFYTETDINVNADYSSIDAKNVIEIKCRYKKTSASSYGNYQTLQDNVTAVLTLDNLYDWDVQVVVTDLFGATTYNLTVPLGMPIIFFDRILGATGFNCFPQIEKDVAANGRSLIKSAITASLENAITNLAESTYTIIPLNLSTAAGDRLTLTNDGGVKIGAGVTHVLVSGRVSYNALTAGAKHVRIMKNSYTNNNTLAWAYQNLTAAGCVDITPTLATVQEGDIIYLYYHTTNSTDTIGGNAYGARTSLTVETV